MTPLTLCQEEVAFSNWINSSLSEDADLKILLPVNPEGGDLYRKVKDGLIIWLASGILKVCYSTSNQLQQNDQLGRARDH